MPACAPAPRARRGCARSSSAASAWCARAIGVDEEICTGDHSCIRLSGCPSLTVKPNPDPLRTDPVATVIDELRRLRLVRRGRACGGAVPVLLSRRDRAQSDAVGPRARARCAARVIAWLGGPRSEGGMSRGARAPVTMLIAALGGEGGGVLTDWIVAAAASLGLPVQSTSIPGVAQRTGATTYYIEIYPEPWSALGGRRPVMALAPGIGDVDIVVASELLEAGRAVAGGFVTPGPHHADRLDPSHLRHRREDGDGRRPLRYGEAARGDREQRRSAHAVRHGARGAGRRRHDQRRDAGRDRRHPGACRFRPRRSRRRSAADGKAVEANLRGFARRPRWRASARRRGGRRRKARAVLAARRALADLEARRRGSGAAQDIVAEGLRRLVAYQDAAYARLYLDRLAPDRARLTPRRRRRPAAARNGAASRRAHVLSRT